MKTIYRSIFCIAFIALMNLTVSGQQLSRISSSSGYQLSLKAGILSKLNSINGVNTIRDNLSFDLHNCAAINVAKASVTDGSGNTYVTGTGSSPDSQRGDFLTIKVNAQGHLAWEKRLQGIEYAAEIGMVVALDTISNPIVSGITWNGHDMDFHTMKLDALTGDIIWEHTFAGNAEGLDVPTAISVGDDGSIVVTGVTYTGNNISWLTLKYDANGLLIWSQVLENAVADSWVEPVSIHIKENGYIGITGYYSNTELYACYYTLVYDSQGHIQWNALYEDNTLQNVNSMARSITSDTEGNWYITGSFNIENPIMRTIKYNTVGTLQWLDSQSQGWSDGYKVIASTSGKIYAAGRHFYNWDNEGTLITAYNPDGTKAWSKVNNDLSFSRPMDMSYPYPIQFSLDLQENPVLAGWGHDPLTSIRLIKTYKYTPDGEIIDQATCPSVSNEFGGFADFLQMGLDNDDNTFLTFLGSYTNLGSVYEVIKLHFNSEPEWHYIFHSDRSSGPHLSTACSDDFNNTYITGYYDTIIDNHQAYAFVMAKYNSSGEIEWEKPLLIDSYYPNPIKLKVTSQSNIALLINNYPTLKIIMYNSNGDSLWAHDLDWNFEVSKLLIDQNNDIYLSGIETVIIDSTLEQNFYTMKYSSQGNLLWVGRAEWNSIKGIYCMLEDATINQAGEIFLTGSAGDYQWYNTDAEMVVIKFNPDGELGWINSYPQEYSSGEGKSIIATETGSIYVNGNSSEFAILNKLNVDGTLAWSKLHGEEGSYMKSGIVVQKSTGELIATSIFDNGSDENVIIIEYDENGNELRVTKTGSSINFKDQYLDASDNLYILNRISGDFYPFRPSFSANGNTMTGLFILKADGTSTEELFQGPELSDFYPVQLIPLTDGRLLLAGNITNEFLMFESIHFFQSEHSLGYRESEVYEYSFAGQNIPNPASGTTIIPISLESDSRVSVSIYDISGRLVSTPFNAELTSGSHKISINVSGLKKGVYMYHVSDSKHCESRKMVVY